MGYSDAEIQAFKEKDRRIVRQSSLKVAADLVIAADKGKSNLATLNLATQTVAQELTDWVYEKGQDGDTKPEPNTNTGLGNTPGATLGQLPEPTLAQKKVLDAIWAKIGTENEPAQLKEKVLQWAEETHGQRSYPAKLDSVDKFINWYNK